MTAATTTVLTPEQLADAARPRPVVDALTIAWRNVLNIRRNPQLLVFSTIQPVIFVLMFRYVFGGAIRTPGVDYIDFLMPGIFVQTVVFGSITTAIGLADDLQRGLIDRFRSLPMARSAVLIGRTLADLLRNVFVVALMAIVGLLVGWSPDQPLPQVLAALGLVFAFSYSMSWFFAIVGLNVRDGETAQAAAFPLMAPLVFASSAFVPVESMPGWLQAFAEHQPVTAVVDAARALTLGGPVANDVLVAVVWIVGIVAISAPLAVARYRRAV
jgi:ABC transporter DrrB family efflux protein